MRLCFVGNLRSLYVRRLLAWCRGRGHEVHAVNLAAWRARGSRVVVHNPGLGAGSLPMVGALVRLLRLRALLRRLRPQVVHCHFTLSSAGALLAARGHPTLLTTYGSDLYQARSLATCATNLLALWLADRVAASSAQLRDFAADRYHVPRAKLVEARWGLDTHRFRPRAAAAAKARHRFGLPSGRVVLSPRGLQPHYNPDVQLRALEQLPQDDVTLVLLRRRAAGELHVSEALRDQVLVIDRYLAPVEMAQLQTVADVTLSLPSSDQLSSAVLESLACGALPVVSDLPVYRELADAGATLFLADPYDPGAVAKALQRALECSDRERIAARNRELVVERFDERKWLAKLEDLYGVLAGGGRNG